MKEVMQKQYNTEGNEDLVQTESKNELLILMARFRRKAP